MIGLYGIVVKPGSADAHELDNCFRSMTFGKELETVRGQGFVLGVARRPMHDNKDLALHLAENGMALAISGYARFSNDDRFLWAVELVKPVMQAFPERGMAGLITLNGCFCICLIHTNRLLIVGDHFGSKNLFYAELGDSFIFAPDVRSVLRSTLVPRERDLEGAKQVLVSGFFLGDRTLVRDIRRFPYGTALEKPFSPWQQSRRTRYWEPCATEGRMDGPVRELAVRLWEKGQAAIMRLDALEKRMAVPLSGGLDSRFIAAALGECRPIKTLTYDMSDEVLVARKVSRVLGAEHTEFDNALIEEASFKLSLDERLSEQGSHVVVNQYFYSPLFQNYLERSEEAGIYDGVYLGLLFSAPYTFREFGPDQCLSIYGRGARGILPSHSRLSHREWEAVVLRAYEEWCGERTHMDGVGRSQLMYLVSRLRRYVSESAADRENYGYVFRPGFDSELVAFGYVVRLELRKGIIYTAMLQDRFPEVMKIRYKDSYGNRQKTLRDMTLGLLRQCRVKLSHGSHGLIPFYPYQAELYFYKLGVIANQKSLFYTRCYIDEIMPHVKMKEAYDLCREKQSLLSLFQRMQFIQQFYVSCGY